VLTVSSESGIFYDMRRTRLNSHTLKLALVGAALVTLAAVACNGDDSSPVDGSPSPGASPDGAVTPVVTRAITPGSGNSPAEAVGTYIDANALDGHQLDLSRETECPLEPVQTIVAGTPTIVSRIGLGQFCLASKDWEPDKAITVIVDLPDTAESWEMKLEFDADSALWTIQDVEKTRG
jgi:hypothetical protein